MLGWSSLEAVDCERKYDAQRSIFGEIRGVWIADETLSPAFGISPQSKQKLKSKRRSKIVKIYTLVIFFPFNVVNK